MLDNNVNQKVYYFKSESLRYPILAFVLLFFLSIWFVLEPSRFLINVFVQPYHVFILGLLGIVVSVYVLISGLFFSKGGAVLTITDEYIIDSKPINPVGKVLWNEILNIRQVAHKVIRIELKNPNFTSNLSWQKKIIFYMFNVRYKTCFYLPTKLIDGEVDEIEKALKNAQKMHRINSWKR